MESGSPFGERPSSFSADEEKSIFEKLKAAQDKLAQKKEQSPAEPRRGAETLEPEPEEDLEEKPTPPEPGEHTLSEFEKLCKVGYGEKVVEFNEGEYAGNRILIRTINQGKELEALSRASAHPPHTQAKAFRIYSLALGALVSINGERYFKRRPISPDDDIIHEKYAQLNRLYPPVLNRLLAEYDKLQVEVEQKAFFAKKD